MEQDISRLFSPQHSGTLDTMVMVVPCNVGSTRGETKVTAERTRGGNHA
jgi:hypothetical protein